MPWNILWELVESGNRHGLFFSLIQFEPHCRRDISTVMKKRKAIERINMMENLPCEGTNLEMHSTRAVHEGWQLSCPMLLLSWCPECERRLCKAGAAWASYTTHPPQFYMFEQTLRLLDPEARHVG